MFGVISIVYPTYYNSTLFSQSKFIGKKSHYIGNERTFMCAYATAQSRQSIYSLHTESSKVDGGLDQKADI